MKPWIHAQSSAKKFGGKPEDYIAIHNQFDSSKESFPDMRHRCIYHHSHGIYLVEKIFGINITNSDGKLISVRDIGEQHCLEDLGFIPTLQDYLKDMPFYEWLGGPKRTHKSFKMEDIEGAPTFTLDQLKEALGKTPTTLPDSDIFIDTATAFRPSAGRKVLD